MEIGWRTNYRVGNYCMWLGIRCNDGSVVEIDLSGHVLKLASMQTKLSQPCKLQLKLMLLFCYFQVNVLLLS
ncbi:hypothetical protein Goshw_006047 [Gossypium schwendimanii]|uniref:Leucine-rich repeat-containing N-terminal plant-type domain-containing protein n=1 Tax=Gossypium schwendimanii TaxID=34291 RepID=A0A7J9LE62_GOSSC|nr:hypothetical protein [Gossypium schwendimanii]